MPRKSKSKAGAKSGEPDKCNACPSITFPIYCPPPCPPVTVLPCHDKPPVKPCKEPVKPCFKEDSSSSSDSDEEDNHRKKKKKKWGGEKKQSVESDVPDNLLQMLGALGAVEEKKVIEEKKAGCITASACAPCGTPAVPCPAATDDNIYLRALIRAAYLTTNLPTATARATQRCLLLEAIGLLCPASSVVAGTPASDFTADLTNTYLEINCRCPTLGAALANLIELASGAPAGTSRVAPPEGCPTAGATSNLGACATGATGPCTELTALGGGLRIGLGGA